MKIFESSDLARLLLRCWSGFGRMAPSVGFAIGGFLGVMFYCFSRSRRQTARYNLGACFGRNNVIRQEIGVIRCFIDLGISIYEMSLSWSIDQHQISRNIEILGRDTLEKAISQRKGVLLIGGHYSAMELIAPSLHSIVGNFAITFCLHIVQAVNAGDTITN